MLRLCERECETPIKEMLHEHLHTGGKRLRTKLAISTAQQLNVDKELIVPWAAACELLHNATLIHDDIQDGDTRRRGTPTLWFKYGQAQGINAGDIGLMLPFRALEDLNISDTIRYQLSNAISTYAIRIASGQSQELMMLPERLLTWEAYERMVLAKTAALFSLPVLGSALLSGMPLQEATELANSILPLGLLFQIQDDLLDLYGEKGRNQQGSDLKEGKVSALVIDHLSRCPEDRTTLLELLETPRDHCSMSSVTHWTRVFERQGTLAAVLDRVHTLKGHFSQDSLREQWGVLSPCLDAIVNESLAPIAHILETHSSHQ